VLAVGDFNAEPFAEPPERLKTCRTIRPNLWRAEQAILYNPSWRLLVERDLFSLEEQRVAGLSVSEAPADAPRDSGRHKLHVGWRFGCAALSPSHP